MRTKRPSYIFRGIAVFFLLFTVADLSTPHLCSEELEGFALPTASFTAQDATTEHSAIAMASSEHQENQSSNPESENEDCFCCCSHIIPSVHFAVESVLLKPAISEPTISSLPTTPPQKPFHPPRLS